MTVSELAKDMKKYVGGSSFITRQELAGFMGKKDPHGVDKYLFHLERIEKRYFIPDVAAILKENSYR